MRHRSSGSALNKERTLLEGEPGQPADSQGRAWASVIRGAGRVVVVGDSGAVVAAVVVVARHKVCLWVICKGCQAAAEKPKLAEKAFLFKLAGEALEDTAGLGGRAVLVDEDYVAHLFPAGEGLSGTDREHLCELGETKGGAAEKGGGDGERVRVGDVRGVERGRGADVEDEDGAHCDELVEGVGIERGDL